jgi:hypothetical protein
MKHRVFFSLAICITTLGFAQDESKDLKLLKDAVMMRDGKMYKLDKDGNMSPYNGEAEFANGTKVTKAGDVIYTTGVRTKLHEGEALLKNGNLAILESKIKRLDGYLFRDGKALDILTTDLRSFEGTRTVADSNKLSSDGKYYLGKSGKFIQLQENEIVSSAGEVYMRQAETPTPESYVMKRDAVVIKAVNNKMAVVDVDYLFPNGTKVSPLGVVSTKEGTSFSLRNGEKINSKGELFLNNEGVYNNGIIKRDGFVYTIKEGKLAQINEEYVIDSLHINQKGIISYTGKPEKFIIKEGDVISLDGKLMVPTSGCNDAKSKKDRFILDHVLFKDGKLFIIKDAETSLLTKEITLSDGSKILKTGHVIKPNGSRLQMHEGQRIALSGEELPDEKPEETSNPDKNYLTVLRGRVWIVTDGKPTLLKEDYNIKGKMIVKQDGQVIKSDGGKIMLKENDRLSLDGIMIPVDKRPLPGQLPLEYYIMKLNKMWVVHDGKPTKLEGDIVTNDGVKVLMDGTIVKKDRQRFMLKEGEKVDTKGELLTAR